MIEELVEYCETQQGVRIRPDVALAALDFRGIVYGTVAIPRDWWRPLEGMSASHVGIENRPMQPTAIRNLSELAALFISPSPQHNGASEYFDLDLRWTPKIGDQVMALGYADLDVDTQGRGEQRPMQQYIYGSVSEVVELESADVTRGRPWPMMRVQANWPGGMSGGPVFNTEGRVVGLVSTGFPGQDIATATFFSSWDIPQQTFQSLDPANPGWFHCIGVYDAEERIRWVGPNRAEASRFAADQNLSDVRAISFKPASQEYMVLQRIPLE
ncbi:S1 family peptidase [Pontivivens ytuae]|uniref:Trypsin-like peptidase domain-containing protein n=1 Tax=Pontivivens ytuae TaxID=2789856 RepID=A0A7S9QDU8_9RHOB|nr:serine protease [Pontivivens ytuae]QPH54742.1 trypsin-like peptidase domain-containing protein [Pontivivens ytuae]